MMLPPKELSRLIRNHYDYSYQDVAARHPETCYKWTLESWEEDVIVRHKMTSGTVLVLGAGVGRESILRRTILPPSLFLIYRYGSESMARPWHTRIARWWHLARAANILITRMLIRLAFERTARIS